MSRARAIIGSITAEYERYKALGEGVVGQLTDTQLCEAEAGVRNSIATVIWHISGNLRSRFSDFLTSDGEKPWRDRESEFRRREVTRSEAIAKWEEGWEVLFNVLDSLRDDDLSRRVTIRGTPLTVHEALHRSLAHTSYHVGQMVYAGRWSKGSEWKWLSIPPGQSEQYNRSVGVRPDSSPETGLEGARGRNAHEGLERKDSVAVTDDAIARPVLYIFSGLPGSGKTTLAQTLAERLKATYLRIDTVEQGLRDLCAIDVQGEGYRLAYRVAADNLRLGVSVVADSCNPIELTRREWEKVALDAEAEYVNIEVVCSDPVEHRRRVESREASVEGLRLPTWEEVERREFSEWRAERLVIETSDRTEEDCFDELVSRLR